MAAGARAVDSRKTGEVNRPSPQRLDPSSRITLFRFSFTSALALVWLANNGLTADVLPSALAFAAAMTGFLALLLRESFCAPMLNRWYEMLAYLALGSLVAAVS